MEAEMETVQALLEVPSISCGACARRIETALRRLDGLQTVTVTVQTRQVHLTYDRAALAQSTIETTLANIGYPVGASEAPGHREFGGRRLPLVAPARVSGTIQLLPRAE